MKARGVTSVLVSATRFQLSIVICFCRMTIITLEEEMFPFTLQGLIPQLLFSAWLACWYF